MTVMGIRTYGDTFIEGKLVSRRADGFVVGTLAEKAGLLGDLQRVLDSPRAAGMDRNQLPNNCMQPTGAGAAMGEVRH